jgi:predicted TIM-barrel fold metal-dependent hydrolase
MHWLKASTLASVLIMVAFLSGCDDGAPTAVSEGIRVVPLADYQADAACAAKVQAMREGAASIQPLHQRYQDLRVIDVHNHGAAAFSLWTWWTLKLQERYFIDRTVLFGKISEPAAVKTDQQAWEAYTKYPDQVVPFFAGIPLRDQAGAAMAAANLEQGYYGIGEIVAASTHSPAASRLPWKAQHPNDGILPELYQLSARYGAPVLLHIDPPSGYPIRQLEQALQENPQAIIIFGHANAYNAPANIERLVSQHPNLVIDFFAGFTAHNRDSRNTLADFVSVIEKYPDQFMVSTDSGYGVGQTKALQAIYELLDLLTPETACTVAHQNMERLIESQLPTDTQIARIEALSREQGEQGLRRLNKRMANELIFELESK